jgi:hypothetical protein
MKFWQFMRSSAGLDTVTMDDEKEFSGRINYFVLVCRRKMMWSKRRKERTEGLVDVGEFGTYY